MIRNKGLALFALLFFPCAWIEAQDVATPRDARAVAVLQQAAVAMGGAAPADCVATGTVTIVSGSKTDSGTVRILTRGLSQSVEEFQTSDGTLSEVFSDGVAAAKVGLEQKEKSLEWASSAQSTLFPLVFIASALSNPDTAFEYVGLEALDGTSAHHIRFWNTFASNPRVKHLAEFSTRDIWINVANGLPIKVVYERREASGAAPRIPMGARYSDYRSVGGVLFPHSIVKIVNGTDWATIQISSVSINTGLAASTFSVQQEEQ
jgi:hypothetical protein